MCIRDREGAAEAIWQFNKAIIDAVYDLIPAVKPQIAMYEQFGIPGDVYKRQELIIRGICCLKTGIPGISENITVKSIVGNFLEHSRIFYFYNNGWENVFMGSADWMPRNLDRRVEIMFPVEDETCKKEVMHILDIQLQDNVKEMCIRDR